MDFPFITPSRHFLKSNLDGTFQGKELCKVSTHVGGMTSPCLFWHWHLIFEIHCTLPNSCIEDFTLLCHIAFSFHFSRLKGASLCCHSLQTLPHFWSSLLLLLSTFSRSSITPFELSDQNCTTYTPDCQYAFYCAFCSFSSKSMISFYFLDCQRTLSHHF